MSLEDIRSQLQQLSDTDLIVLLNDVSDEVKRRNTIMKGILGDQGPEVRKETVQQGLRTILDALSGGKSKG
jgi:hypothetical protein